MGYIKIDINYAELCDLEYLIKVDKHTSKEMIIKKIELKEIITIRVDTNLVGLLRYNYFWDNTPFMNLLYFNESFRRKGLGSKVVYYWENLMNEKGYKIVMTSTLANEEAQFFYRKIGYKDAGCLLLENEPIEILFTKSI